MRWTMLVVKLSIVVTPRARRARIDQVDATTLRVAVTAPPHEGQANEAVINAVAEHLGVPRSRIRIVQGLSSRRKVIEVEGLDHRDRPGRDIVRRH